MFQLNGISDYKLKADYAKYVWPIPALKKEERFYHPIVGEAFSELAFYINYLQEHNERLAAEAEKTRDEIREEFKEELEQLSKRLENCIEFSDLEMERKTNFIRQHYAKHGKNSGVTLHMVGTGVGTCYELECPICHEKENITDYDTW